MRKEQYCCRPKDNQEQGSVASEVIEPTDYAWRGRSGIYDQVRIPSRPSQPEEEVEVK